MLIVRYDPVYGLVLPDAMIYAYVTAVCERANRLDDYTPIKVGSQLIIDAFRLAKKKGTLMTTLMFRFDDGNVDHAIAVDSEGRCDNWPLGFCDMWEHILTEMLMPS